MFHIGTEARTQSLFVNLLDMSTERSAQDTQGMAETNELHLRSDAWHTHL